MNSVFQRLYWASPYFLKCTMASLNARKLDKQRHNDHFEELIKQICQQNVWSDQQFKEFQKKHFAEVISKAALNVPYYNRLFKENHLSPDDFKDFDDLKKLPILEKSVIRDDPISLLDQTLDKKNLITLSTSGTTGTPLILYRTKYLNAAACAFIEVRNHGQAKMQRRVNRSVSIGGHLVAAPERKSTPFWVYNKRWDQLYMSSYHLSAKNLGSYVDKLQKFKAEYIEGYPSSVCAIAQHIIENNLKPVEFKACFTTAEILSDDQRKFIKDAFMCRTYNQYGCGELAILATECSQGNMHLSPEISYVEVVDEDDQPLPVGQTGQLICTTLLNKVQPLIRYRIGDRGALDENNICPCGSSMPLIKYIDGRSDHVLITKDGRKIGRLDPIFKGVQGVKEAQIIQKDYDLFVIRIVPAANFSEKNKTLLIENLLQRLGPANIQVSIVDKIQRTTYGKFKAIICELPQVKK